MEKTAEELMETFAERTGLTSDAEPTRYLWTDAFAVCNYVGLSRVTGEARYLELAESLVKQVHETLGRHRADDPREGWISGLEGAEARAHPTAGGLRIGKSRPERGPDEQYDSRREWDRDGQYFHYLTEWMHALDVLARATADPDYHRWSRELAVVAHEGFVHDCGVGYKKMYWKMSIDLSRPQVTSMGHHDPLDGLVTCAQIIDTGRFLDGDAPHAELETAAEDFAQMVEGRDFTTDDPLGLGGLLMDVARLVQLGENVLAARQTVSWTMVRAAHEGLERLVRSGGLRQPASARLAFRELGLAIGLSGAALVRERLEQVTDDAETVSSLMERTDFADDIVGFWLEPAHRDQDSWTSHRDINCVMLATALQPHSTIHLEQPDPDTSR